MEALQTDIMRFMAILGLCLAAIFSLVQGAAQEQSAAQQATPERAVAQPVTIDQAAAEGGNVELAIIEPATLEPSTLTQSVVQPPIVEPVTVKPVTVEPVTVAPHSVEPGIVKPVEVKPVKAKAGKVQSTAIAEAAAPVPAARETSSAMAPSAPAVGFTLEFASVQALEMLLQARRVQLYARQGDQFWAVNTDAVAAPVGAPASYYEMHTGTVPLRLRDSLQDVINGAEITWGVTLPTAAIKQIQQLTAGSEGGNLLIGHDGVVALEGPTGAIP